MFWNLFRDTEDDTVASGETVRFAMLAAAISSSDASYRAGTGGSNYYGAFVAIVGDGMADHAWYFTHDGLGWDPQPYNASLSGFTMHSVDLAAGSHTDAQVATALRAAISGAALYTSAGGSSANVDVLGDIDASACFTGSSSPGAAASWGCHVDVPVFDADPIDRAMQAFATFTAGPALVTAIGMRLNSAGDTTRAALYTGGSIATGPLDTVADADLVGTTLRCETLLVGSGTGWVWQSLGPTQVTEVADNAPVHYLLKGETSSTHGSFVAYADVGDLNDQQLCVFVPTVDGIDPDPSVAYPATLEGADPETSFSVVLMAAFEYRTSPQRGDAGGITVTAL